MKKILLQGALILGAGLIFLGLAATLVLAKPEAFFPKNAAPTFAKLARLAGVYLKIPDDAKLTVESLSFRDKRIVLDTPYLCYDGIAPHASGCFGRVRAEVVLRLVALPPRLLKIGPVTAEDGKFEVSLPSTSPAGEKPSAGAGLPAGLAFGAVDIRLTSLQVTRGDSKWTATVALQTEPAYSLTAEGQWTDALTRRAFSVAVKANGNLQLAKGKIDGWLEKPVPQLNKVAVEACGFELKELTKPEAQWTILCPVEATAAPNLVPKEWAAGWDRKVRLLLHGSGDPHLAGTMEADLLPFQTSLVHGRGKVTLPLSVIKTGKGSAVVETELHVIDFRRVKELIDDKSYAVPSPLNSLKGELRIATNGKAEIDTQSGRIPFQVHTRLASGRQTFNVGASGSFAFEKTKAGLLTELDLNLSLADVTLVLPPLDPRRLPRIFPDPRIHLGDRELADAAPSRFHYKIHLTTPPGHPARLLSNLANAPVPIDLDLTFGSATPMVGHVSVAAFPAEVLRRKATVKYFKVDLSEKYLSPPLSGEIEVVNSIYKIRLLVNGTVDTPRLSLLSDPPLSEEDAYSVLIFGRPMEELTPKDGDTVANLRAALSNRAVGLASMYLLATTPVESVTYDPSSNQFSAKIRIADGTSLSVGSDLKNVSQLGLKRRIGPSWILNTFIDNPFGTREQRSVSSFLEWSKRY